MNTIGFAGLSHLGIVSSVATAAQGFRVIGYDPDGTLCSRLAGGELPIVEPQLPQLLAQHGGKIRFTNDVRALQPCDVVICSSDVPTGPDAGESVMHSGPQIVVA